MNEESGNWRWPWKLPVAIDQMWKEEVFRVAQAMGISMEDLYSEDEKRKNASRIAVYEFGVIAILREMDDEELKRRVAR